VELNLVNVRGDRPPSKGPVVLVHGAGVRGNIFRAPVRRTVVDALLDDGYDVWLENWRASIEFEPREWTLDEAALYDHPAAVRTVCEQTGADRVKAVIHCQGSTSFTMSACAGLLPQVDTIVSNAVSLHTAVPAWSRVKLRYALPTVRPFLRYLDPGWGDDPPSGTARLLTTMVKAVHHECRNTACRMVSFTYGSGFPALWRHENLNEPTHDGFIPREFGHVPMSFFRQMGRCVQAGHLVSDHDDDRLPRDHVAQEPATDARFALFCGELNRCFLPEGQRQTHRFLSRFGPRHTLHILPGYSHLDVFMSGSAARDVFPLMLAELERPVPSATGGPA
jgi:pimeloyl-ACP methyl ester carboxylesterase